MMLFLVVTVFVLFALLSENDIRRNVFANGSTPDNSTPVYTNQDTCPGVSSCTCSMDGNYVSVTCINLTDIDNLLRYLKVKYESTIISHVYISKSVIDHLPPRAFENLYIKHIFIRRSVVNNVSDEAFLGIEGLTELRLDDFNFLRMPSSIGAFNNTLRAMWMENGDLEYLQTTFQNFTQMQLLSLKNNKIATIHPLAFLHTTNLNTLNLSNNTIMWLDPRTFSSLNQLRYLNLMGNQLQSTDGLFDNHQFSIQTLVLAANNISDIANFTRNPLYSLNQLVLDNNPFRILTNNSLAKCPRLQLLSLQRTKLVSIESGAFKTSLRFLKIDISHNALSHLDNETFANMKTLKYVDASHNQLTAIDSLFQNTPQILDIFVSNNRLKEIDQRCFHNSKLLNTLHINRNFLTRIEEDTFANNGALQKLVLIENRIKYLEPNCFRGLHSLLYLTLKRNLLRSLNGSLNNLTELQLLDLSYNYLFALESTSFQNMPSLQIVDVAENSLISVEGAFVNLMNLQILRLQNNHLKGVTEESFSSSAHLKLVQLSGNPLKCNCLLKWLVELLADKSVAVDEAKCETPEWLSRKRLSELSVKDITQWPEDCPPECICSCFPNSTDYYIGVSCAGLHLPTVPNILPSKTAYLDLSRNQIDSVSRLATDNLTQLQHLLLHGNNLTSIPDLSTYELRTLTLASNHLARFPVSRVNSNHLQRVTLSNNRWLCDCQALPFQKWLLAYEVVVSDVNRTLCVDVEDNGNLRNRRIVSLTEALLCPSLVTIYASIIVGVLGFLLLVAGGKIAYNRYHLNIKIWMYSRGICSGLSCIKEEDFDDDKQFDAFVSYSGLDETFVVRELVPMLECCEKPYHLCLHYRHFAPGSYVQDSIIQAVQLSKRTILVLSKNFLQSEWCRLEFKSAHHLVLEERLNRLIVIILGDLPPKDDIDPEINLYLETTTYLRWGENNFWNKLNYVMPRSPCVVTDEDKMRLLD